MESAARPLKIDLSGMSLRAVVEALKESGYKTQSYQTEMWVTRDKARYGSDYQSPPVFVVTIEEEDASNLTCTIFNGKTVTLKPGQDLHLMLQIPGGEDSGQWCIVRSNHIMA